MVLNTGLLDWESSALTTRPLLKHKNIVLLSGAQAPDGESFLLLFQNSADFDAKC